MSRFVSLGELKLGLRLIGKQPILSATIVLALATGIAMATMGFTVLDALLYGQLPYANGDRFIRIGAFDRDGRRSSLDLVQYRVLLDTTTTLDHVGAGRGRPFSIEHPSGELEQVQGATITPRSMRVIPGSPIAGRTLIDTDGLPGAEPVVLIRDSLWKRRYGADPGLIGQQINIAGRMRTVIGVMPDTFEFPGSGELWIPIDDLTLGGSATTPPDVNVFGVIKPGVGIDAVNAELAQVTAAVASDPSSIRIRAWPYTGDSDNANVAMSVLVAVLVMLLLVIASNVATLTLARTWARASELAVRSALGAGRARVVAQIFGEALVLGAIAAVIGLTAAHVVLRYLSQTLIPLPFWVSFDPNPRTMLFVVFLTLLVSAVSGLLPALRVTRHDLRDNLHAGRGSALGGFGRVGATLLVVEIALSIALLNGAVTMARAFRGLTGEVPALPKGQILTAHLGRVPDPVMRDRVVEAASKLPGVMAAGAASHLPFESPLTRPVSVEGLPAAPRRAPSQFVGPGFLEAIGAHAVAGRLLTATDFLPGAAPVVVVNEPFVQKFFGGRNAIGQRIRNEGGDSLLVWHEIVGVVPDLGLSIGDPAFSGGFYIPVRDERLWYVALRTTADPRTLIAPLRKAVASVDPDLQLEELVTLEEAAVEERAFVMGVSSALTAMGGMALLLSIVGIYALLSFMVTRRTREIGIRVALGANNRRVLTSIVGAASVYLAIGGALGTALGIAFVEMRSVILIQIPAPGILMPLTIVLTLAVAGASACWVPARRALRIRPAEALAAE